MLYGIICIQLAGCSGWVIRTSKERKPRVDQEIIGNRGFIFGKPTSAAKEPSFKERTVYRVEVEIPQWKKKKEPLKEKPQFEPTFEPTKEDKRLWGNKGYIFENQKQKIDIEKTNEVQTILPITIEPEAKKTVKISTYKVKTGDTLQKISAKFYGTTKRWTLIYKANRDKIKSPDKVFPGQVLVIPEVDQFKK
jgi:nucleoid-associated protein YgaU